MRQQDNPPYRLELSSAPDLSSSDATQRPRPYLSILFACCNIYTRVYRNSEGTAYKARCPHCGRQVDFRVGPDGTDARFFVVH